MTGNDSQSDVHEESAHVRERLDPPEAIERRLPDERCQDHSDETGQHYGGSDDTGGASREDHRSRLWRDQAVSLVSNVDDKVPRVEAYAQGFAQDVLDLPYPDSQRCPGVLPF